MVGGVLVARLGFIFPLNASLVELKECSVRRRVKMATLSDWCESGPSILVVEVASCGVY